MRNKFLEGLHLDGKRAYTGKITAAERIATKHLQRGIGGVVNHAVDHVSEALTDIAGAGGRSAHHLGDLASRSAHHLVDAGMRRLHVGREAAKAPSEQPKSSEEPKSTDQPKSTEEPKSTGDEETLVYQGCRVVV